MEASKGMFEKKTASGGEQAPGGQGAGKNVPLGRIVITQGALHALTEEDVRVALRRHMRGDWGELGSEDWAENELSLKEGFRLLSAYKSKAGVKFWVITEADRSATTILLPNEY